jgi:hypothetical protein
MWYLLVGAPGESAETLKRTFETINRAASRWDLVNIGVGLRVYKGAPIADDVRGDSAENSGLLFPVAYEPSAISLADAKTVTKMEALRRTNYFMYDEDETTPVWVQKIGACLLGTFAPQQPIWRMFIVLRILKRSLGLDILTRLILALRMARPVAAPDMVEDAEAIPVER